MKITATIELTPRERLRLERKLGDGLLTADAGDPWAETALRHAIQLRLMWKPGCKLCKDRDGPPHEASARCESGMHNHCTCDTCF